MSNQSSNSDLYDFSGSIPEHYDRYLGPMFFEPYAIEVAERMDPSKIHVALELAAGTGRVSRQLRKRLPPTARLIASDISPDMLAVAKEKLANENIEWKIIDAQQLPFEDNSIDLVVCCFGLMFVPDRENAFREIVRVLRPGNMFIMTTWDKLETSGTGQVYRQVVKSYLEDPLPETYSLPFSLSDERVLQNELRQAGFSRVSVEKVPKNANCDTAKEAAEGITQGGAIYNEIMKRNPAWVDEIKGKVENELKIKFGEKPMIAPMSALVTQAWK